MQMSERLQGMAAKLEKLADGEDLSTKEKRKLQRAMDHILDVADVFESEGD